MIKKIDHFVITAKNINDTIAFYENLGFTAKNDNGRYELFAGNFKINVHLLGNELSPHAKCVKTGSADFCFEVSENIDNFKQKLESNGLFVELGVVPRTGALGKMNSVYLRDPDGNLVEFCSYE